VNKNKLHNSGENTIIPIFRALKSNAKLFVVSSAKSSLAIFALMLLVFTLVVSSSIAAKSAKIRPTKESIVIFPSEVSSVNWKNVQTLSHQDLRDFSLYQEFTAENSAFLTPIADGTTWSSDNTNQVDIEPSPNSSQSTSDSAAGPNDTPVPVDSVPFENPAVSEPSIEEPVIENPVLPEVVPESLVPEVVPEAPTSEVFPEPAAPQASAVQFGVPDFLASFKPAVGLFSLAQAVTTTPIAIPDLVLPEPEVPVVEDSVPSENIQEPTLAPEAPIEVKVVAGPEVVNEPETIIMPSISSLSEMLVEPLPLDIIPSTELVTESPIESEQPKAPYSITLKDFGIPQLASGQFVDNLQLRLSLGGQYNSDASSTPAFLTARYSFGGFSREAGSILLDGEVSNAINGGYYVLSLPSIQDPTLLSNLEITLSFEGDVDRVQSLYVDAAWLEMATVVYDKQLLKDRSLPENLKQLTGPKTMNFLSDELDFTRDEIPQFSLRYNSQRNFIVQAFRSLFSHKLATVKTASLMHSGGEPIGVTPDISMTADGLISVVFSEADKTLMKPGVYTLELGVDEGGYVSTDSFEFQWGLLSINTNQTEYTAGNAVNVSMGALTSNGNTLCDANLNLYVTIPNGFIDSIPVAQSGQCFGNNVINVPDYSTQFTVEDFGVYEMYLERVDDAGNIISHITDTFNVVPNQEIVIERTGPTRIFPPAPYPMQLTVHALKNSFVGKVVERVPNDFIIFNTTAQINKYNDYTELVWDVSMLAGTSETVSYEFDAPDLSPYLYKLGPAQLISDKKSVVIENVVPMQTASTSEALPAVQPDIALASGTDPLGIIPVEAVINTIVPVVNPSLTTNVSNVIFLEHRSWQIASDATGNMILFWDNAASIPAGWSCLSCGSGTFFQNFAMGGSAYNTTGGATTHTHTATGAVNLSALATTNGGGSTGASVSHTHAYTPTINAVSNLPLYRQLRVIQYTTSAGEPAVIPAGAIGIFDVASSSLPSGWNRYAAQDGYYLRGENVPGTTGGANTHTHTITGTTGASVGAISNANGTNGAVLAHTHTVSSNTVSINSEPPYINVLLGKITANGATPNTLIAMWTDTVPTGWTDVSSGGSDPFNGKFLKAATTYGTTGGVSTHTHANVTGIVSSGPSGGTISNSAGASGASSVHTHLVDVTGFNTSSNLPPYLTVIFGKRANYNAIYSQTSVRWYVNTDGQTPSDPWPAGGTNLVEKEAITATSSPVKLNEVVRLRMSATVSNATAAVGQTFKLQYSATNTCSAAVSWSDVGTTTSSVIWRGYNNATPADHGTLPSRLLTASNVSETYEENGYATVTPNAIIVGNVGEWDFTLQNNGAAAGTNYCFRMVKGDSSPFFAYNSYAKLLTNQAPTVPAQSFPFDYGKSTTTPVFSFVASDAESDALEYEIIIDDNHDFSSPTLTKDSANYPTDAGWTAATFASAATAKYIIQPADALTSGTTYWWKVRSRDPSGSNTWSAYSSVRSLTIDSTLIETAWHQTLGLQFDSTIMSNAATTTGGVKMISTGQTAVPVVESGWTTATAVPANNITLNKPAGVNVNDLLLIFVGNDAVNLPAQWSGATLAAAGFTLISEQGNNTTDSHVAAFYKVADGTEASSVNIVAANSANYWGYYIRVSGVNPANPFDQVGTAYLGGNVTAKALPSITTTINNELAFYVMAADGGDQFPFSVTAPWVESAEIQAGTLATNASGVWGTQDMVTLGAAGNANITSTIANGAAGFLFALNPAVTTSGTVMSPEIDFDWVSGHKNWGLVQWNTTEPVGSDSKLRMYYTNATACDTIVPDAALAGNSAGFDVSASGFFINSLSTSTYNRICLNMELSVQSTTTSPTLDDWTVKWVIPNQPPSVPQLADTPTFDNYKSTTTKPTIGGFAATDYEADNMEYEISVDDNYSFSSPVFTKQSSNYPTDSGWSAATFAANATTTYTIQPADALTNGTTYYWRVRARDPLGTNTWTGYSEIRSITISNAVSIPEWYQATDEQFVKDLVFTNATTTGSDGVTIENGSVSVALLDAWSTGNTKTISSGADRILVVSIISEDGGTNSNVNTVTYGGQALTEITDQQIGTGFSNGAWVGYLDETGIAAAVGTSIVPTWVGGAPSNGTLYTSAVFEDVNQVDPVRNFSANALTSGTTITPAASISVTSGDMMLYISESATGLTHTAATNYTEGTEQDTGGSGFVAASAYRAITSASSEYPEAIWSGNGNRLLMVAVALQPSPAAGSVMSSEIDFDWVANQNDWGEIIWHVTEPAGSDSRLRVYYTAATACDTIVPDVALAGNGVGFQSGGSPTDISSLSTSTYNRICLEMTLDSGTALSFPILTDWGVSWQLSSVFEQTAFWWYNNINAVTPTDIWPVVGTDLVENAPIVAGKPTKTGDVLRLRMGVGVSSVNATDDSFKLQYAAGLGCSESLSWFDVGPVGSTTALWRGYNNAAIADGATLPSAILSGTNVLETYEEENNSSTLVNPINTGQYGEWDWVIRNQALSGTSYCFRMVNQDGSRFKTYTQYPQLVTNQSPTIVSINTPFDNEKTPDLTPPFDFTGVDPEGESIDYQIEIDNDADFSSTVINQNSVTNLVDFSNLITISDKSPFNDSETIRYQIPSSLTNGVTYWWRVRPVDTDGSANYGDWTTARSFTVDTSLTLTTWFQTTQAQFDTDTLEGTDATAGNLVTFASGSTTGTTTSSAIDFDNVTFGNAWGSFSFNETGAANNILYHIEYYAGSGWSLIPDSALVGNAAGYDTSPVSLIDLDTGLYNQIRIRANFLAGSPTLTDWTVSWGERVSVPTHLKLFDNEKTGTLTPTFNFLSTDPQGDDLEYEFSWSTDNTFVSGSSTVNSSTSAGFVNITSGGDTNPFLSGDTISYTMQSALTNGNTYWWRMRAKDPSGGNAYSFWSDPWSFTVDITATTSTWFQTTNEQFNTDTKVGLVATGGSVSTIPASVATYNFSGITSPSATHVGRDFQVTVNDPTDPPTIDAIDTITVLGTSVSTPNLRSGIAGYASDAEATNVQYTSLGASDNNWWTITDPGAGNHAVFWTKFHVSENPSNINQLDLLLEGYQGGIPGARKGWFGIWRPGTTTPYWQMLEASVQTADHNYTGSITSNISEYFDGNNDVHLIFFNEDDSDSLLVDYVAMTVTSNTATAGTITGTPLDFNDGDGPAWGKMLWTDVEPGASSLKYQLEYLNGVGAWELIPDVDLASNSTGYTTAPIDLKYLNTTTYNQIRPVGNMVCSGANCPTLNDWTIEWSRGFTVSGTAFEYDGVTPMTSGTAAVAVNGVLQTGKTATISAGAWTINNVTYFAGDVVTVFIDGAADADEAVAVTKYDGTPDVTGMRLQKRHLTIGSNDNATVTNTDIKLYDFTNDEDLFFDVNGSNVLSMCADTGCSDAGLSVLAANTYSMNANTATHDVNIAGTLIGGANTLRASGSWVNTGTSTLTNTTVMMTATSTAESINTTGAVVGSFNNLTLGETSGAATWTLSNALDVNGTLKVDYGTLARSNKAIYVAGTLTNSAAGYWTGIGTTTIDGSNPTSWTDNNAVKQNIGNVVVDGATKTLVLQTNTAMQSLMIGADDIFDLNSKTTTIFKGLNNTNTFTPRSGTVVFAATSTAQAITMGASSFYNLTFSGVGGGWAFTNANLTVSNDFSIATGTVTMPTGTTTIVGSFNATGGAFAHNNGTMFFTSAAAETLTFSGGPFTNVANNLVFTGSGNWTITDTNATSTNDVRVTQGTINFPSGIFAVGGRLADTGGAYVGGTGTVKFYSSSAEVLTAGGSSFNNVIFDGIGSWSFSDVSINVLGNLLINQGTLTLPVGTTTIGGSYTNAASVNHGSGTVLFNAVTLGKTVNFGASSLYNVTFNSISGGWTITAPATTTNNFTLVNGSSWTLNSGQTLSVSGLFTNSVGGNSTTWSGSTLVINSGSEYEINSKTTPTEQYENLIVGNNTDISSWNSAATSTIVAADGSLYSQDNAGVDGSLYIFGDYHISTTTEYWSYATDFDGTVLGVPRKVSVSVSDGSVVSLDGGILRMIGEQ
jgi:hypothetical protein